MKEKKSVGMERVQKLRREAQRMLDLLKEPEFGLFTWMEMVDNCRNEINAIMDGKRDY